MLANVSWQWSPVVPTWLAVALALVLLAAVVASTAVLARKGVAPRWVAALGLLRIAAWLLFVLVLLQPVIATTRTEQPRPGLLVLVDTSKSMAQPGAGGTRLDEARGHLQGGDFAAALSGRFEPAWFAFDRTARRVGRGDLERQTPDGRETRVADSLKAAHDLLRAEDRRVARVLLVSDGNDRGDGDPAELARRLGVPVDVLAPTSRPGEPSPVLEVADVQGARRVLLGSETHFRVRLRAEPPPAADRAVKLHVVEDGRVLQELPVTLKAGQAEHVVTAAHRPPATGTRLYEFRLGGATGSAKLPVQVVDSKYEILVLEDTWRWEYKYLHRLFEDDPSVRFTALLPRGGTALVQFGSPDRRVSLVGFPQGRGELEPFDLFFLGDVDPSRWPPGVAAGLARLVADEGKSLVVVAGPNVAKLADVPELHALLPVDLTAESGTPVAGPVDVRLRPDAASSPLFFQVDADQLPAVDQVYPALRKRPGAAVLVEAAKQRNSYGPLIVMAEHTVGRGRVLFVGTDTLWKWHTLAAKDGPTPYAVFWQQALRALTPERSRLGPAQVWLTPARTRVEAGRPVGIEAEVASDRPVAAGVLQGAVTGPDGKRRPLAFAPDPGNPRRFRADVTLPAAGTYQVQGSLLIDGKATGEGLALVQADEPAGEASDEGVDRAYLQRLATATGGRWVDPAGPGTWPEAAADEGSVTRSHTFDLWHSFTLLLALCVVLGADWFARLFKGLV